MARLCSEGKTRGATRRLGRGTCKTRALLAPRARTERARRNANACHRAWVRLALSRPRLGVAGSLVDMLVCPEVQVHSAMTKVMSKLFMHSRCLTKCHRHLGSSWGGQILQIRVSLEARKSGEVSL